MNKILMTVALGGILSTAAYAQNPIDKREHNQRGRIQQGVRSGELTRPEARRLAVEEARIRLVEARAKKGGEVTAREALRLDHRLDAASRDIYRQKHDRQDR